ncbi:MULTISPECIES: FHA domain-containing protein [unclassified Adlercreutzia]|uniref:FHA domain-containing protein n=1 Tax=unclassified Adlercreutzia TaxID=2636013 RepID=UPI0013EAB9A7|nr:MULTISPECIES: FHA domain-containing protein [unclassified Adlercreutzia]
MTERCPVCQSPVNPGDASCAQCGFKLLGATQKFKPLVLDEQERASAKRDACECVLRVVRGPQVGVTYRLSPEERELTIGRSPQCSIFLNDMTVSRMHATLRREGDCYVIADENSFNGVWVNNQSVEAKALRSGDFVQIGTFCLLYEESAL